MLADNQPSISTGTLLPTVQLPGYARYALLDFIHDQLPAWRAQIADGATVSENSLTANLCSYLTEVARLSEKWSYVQFLREDPDEENPQRAIDVAVKPCGAVFLIDGQKYIHKNSLLPIECKRLPTPKGSKRDEREYVTNHPKTTGGMQRFKFGHHGAAHKIAGMIGYIQEQTSDHWFGQINDWIKDLSADSTSGWSEDDFLRKLKEDAITGLCKLDSRHKRKDLDAIDIRHLWIKM